MVDALLSSLPNTFAGTSVVESAAGPALQAAFMVTQHLGGKLLMFQAAVPSSGAFARRAACDWTLRIVLVMCDCVCWWAVHGRTAP